MINENRLTYYNSLSSLEYHAFSFSLFTISFFANVRWYLKNPRVWLVSDVWLDSRKQVWIYCIILALYQKPHQPQYLEWTLHLPSQTQIILPYVWPFIFTNDKKKVLFPSESHSVQHLWAISVQRTMLDVFFFGFLDQFLPPTHALIKEIIHEYLLYILGMSGLPLPSQWVAKPGTVCVCVCVCTCVLAQLLSHVQLFEAPWTVAYQAPEPMEFFRWEYWSRVPFLTPWDLPDLEIQRTSPVTPALVKPQKRSIKFIILFDLIIASIAFSQEVIYVDERELIYKWILKVILIQEGS